MGAHEASPTMDDRVAAYVRRCRREWGGGEALAVAIAPLLGYKPNVKTVFSWGAENPRSRHQAPAVAIFAMALITPQISLDEAVMGRESVNDLIQRYRDLMTELEGVPEAVDRISSRLEELHPDDDAAPREKSPTGRGS